MHKGAIDEGSVQNLATRLGGRMISVIEMVLVFG
jgi:hypothetical protein